MKPCKRCNTQKEPNEFYNSQKTYDGKEAICKMCRIKGLNKKKYAGNPKPVKGRKPVPSWHDQEYDQIMEAHLAITELRTAGWDFHLDHIVPMGADNVCGLHCVANLQILSARENLLKGHTHVV